jgi:hypothetical protein
MTAGELAAIGAGNPIMTEVLEMLYSLENPDLLDSSLTEKTLGLAPTPLDDVLAETAKAFSPRA